MRKRAEQRKRELTTQLSAEIRDLKQRVDEKHKKETALRDEMDRFMVQYDTFVRELDAQRRELEGQIRRCRYQIEHFCDEEPEFTKEGAAWDEAPSAEGDTEEPALPHDPGPSLGEAVAEEKQRIRKFFARHWHPDQNRERPHQDKSLMAQVNVAFDECQDAVEMLTMLPWSEEWVKRQEEEKMGTHWERLVEWQTHLGSADERLTQRLERLTRDWRFPLYQEWTAAPKKQDYFAGLARRERMEIRRLEETLATLQEQLEQMEEQTPKTEAE